MPLRRRRDDPQSAREFAPVWPDDQDGLPPLDGVVPALYPFEEMAELSPFDAEITISEFLAQLGAGVLEDADPDDPMFDPDDVTDWEELLNGIVELCLHHLDAEPPAVIVDFLWSVACFTPERVQWPVAERLAASSASVRPAWAAAIGHAVPTGAYLVAHETGDGYDVAITLRYPGLAADHVVAVYIDHNIGGMAKDFIAHPDADEFLALSRDEPGMTVAPLDLAVAAATIDAAIDVTFETGAMAPVSDKFSALFSLVEHVLDKIPGGAEPLADRAPADAATQAGVVDAFLSSDGGAPFADDRDALAAAVEFVVDQLGGDPLRWTPVVVQVVLAGWLPLSGVDVATAERFFPLLRTLVPWAHEAIGWADRYVDDTLAIIDAVENGEDGMTLSLGGESDGSGSGVEILEQAIAAGVDLNDEAALDAFLDAYLED